MYDITQMPIQRREILPDLCKSKQASFEASNSLLIGEIVAAINSYNLALELCPRNEKSQIKKIKEGLNIAQNKLWK